MTKLRCTQSFDVLSQNSHAKANEKCKPAPWPVLTVFHSFWEPAHARAVASRERLVGECDRQNSRGLDPLFDHVSDALRDDPSLAGSGPGQYQIAPDSLDSLPLLRIERCKLIISAREFTADEFERKEKRRISVP